MAIETLGAALRQMNRLFAGGIVTGLPDAQLLERFASDQDAAAFEALVARHGPMVLSVCRGILKDPNDAEDAFQATFLILVKKSGTVRGHVALGPWLYRVAYRVAIRANAAAARRRACERRAGQMAAATATSGPTARDETLHALHEEIARLPEKLRRAVILCDLQRVSRDRAAGELLMSESTLQRRLTEGRQRLKARLIRRGLAHEGGMLGAIFLREAQTAVPAAWGEAAVRSAMATVTHAAAAGVVSVVAKQWTREVLNIMLLQKTLWASAVLLAVGLIAWGASAFEETPSDQKDASSESPPRRKAEAVVAQRNPTAVDTPGGTLYRGRVVGPDGRPVAGAKLYQTPATGYLFRPYPAPESATSGQDGRFAFAIPKGDDSDWTYRITAAAPNYGPGWVEVPPDGKRDDLTLRLVQDDVPIAGRIIDLEGKPIRSASVQVLQINAAPDEKLDRWLEAAKARKRLTFQLENEHLPRETIAISPTVTTDAEGRFRLTGIGRNRLVLAQLDGPTIVSERLHILTRPGNAIEVLEHKGGPSITYYGSAFQHVAAPCKPIVGVVRDRDTQKPLASVTVRSLALSIGPNSYRQFDLVRTTTDAEGRYRLTGMPKGRGNRIMAVPAGDQPYPVIALDAPDSLGLEPVTVDVELRRGVWIEGRITDKLTGKPLRASVEYFSVSSNPNLGDYPGFDGAFRFFEGVRAKEDGSYRVIGLPGPGLIAVQHVDHYLRAPERDDEEGANEDSLHTAPYHMSFTSNYSAIARIDPAKGVDSVKRDVTLDPGWTFTGKVLGPDGQPLAGVWGIGLMKTAEFTVHGFNPRRPRKFLFLHPAKGLVGMVRPPDTNGGSTVVNVQRGATVTGRLVDEDGRPRADVELTVASRPNKGQPRPNWGVYLASERFKTDREGRFRIGPFWPDYEFRLEDADGELPIGDGLRLGETKDLGDVRMKGNGP